MIPRKVGDGFDDDIIYKAIDEWSPEEGVTNIVPPFEWPEDAERQHRSREDMAAEAAALRDTSESLEGLSLGALPKDHLVFASVELDPGSLKCYNNRTKNRTKASTLTMRFPRSSLP